MPWKGIKNPYKIWISEIILQQTRVEQGISYYEKLVEKFPTLTHLANASEQELFALWQGLGYYNRCRNMLQTAKFLVLTNQAKFPKSYNSIRALKGIGDYTAAAIASFAYNLPYAVVDGNVVRVLSRIFGIKENFHTAAGKKFFQQFASELLDQTNSAIYNQAIMDFGATICTPLSPKCEVCSFSNKCIAFTTNSILIYPAKKEKITRKIRYFHFWLILNENKICIQKRTASDIWQNLYILPYLETESLEIFTHELPNESNSVPTILFSSTQVLSHQKIIARFYQINNIDNINYHSLENLFVPLDTLSQFGFPKTIISFFKKFNYL